PRFAGFSRELALEENLAKRVMEEHRAKATMVFHHLRSGGSMEKIVPKGDFFHRLAACRSGEVRNRLLSAKIKFITKDKREFTTYLAIFANRCWWQFFYLERIFIT
ncbi:hypothetical protein SL054_002490, partial [Flavobacterium psychrophilum]|nr:hypothetical protein [Flavobacterium psychrophilum]